MRPLPHLLALVAVLGLAACASLRRHPLAGAPGQLAQLPGFEGVRAVQGYASPAMQASFSAGIGLRVDRWRQQPGATPSFQALVLGAGGPNGAFGAGFLVGWTESGRRPVFDVVTGVSVGALIAPFAFVGSELDSRLTPLFREFGPQDVYRNRGAVAALFDESMMDAAPLRARINGAIGTELLEAVADAHSEGRRLYVGTTNFDIGQLVVWDMGAIASRRSQEALDLFRAVLLASSSVPVFYPPVLMDVVSAAGIAGDEMHVDGSVASPMFLPNEVVGAWGVSLAAGADDLGDPVRVLTVLHNGALTPTVAEVPRDTVDIAARAFLMAASSMVQEELFHLYLIARAWNAEFRFACIPDQAELTVLGFSAEQTQQLFDLGRRRGREVSWEPAPPSFLVPNELRDLPPLPRGAPDPARPAPRNTTPAERP